MDNKFTASNIKNMLKLFFLCYHKKWCGEMIFMTTMHHDKHVFE